jgi:hypothetical protein
MLVMTPARTLAVSETPRGTFRIGNGLPDEAMSGQRRTRATLSGLICQALYREVAAAAADVASPAANPTRLGGHQMSWTPRRTERRTYLLTPNTTD